MKGGYKRFRSFDNVEDNESNDFSTSLKDETSVLKVNDAIENNTPLV